MFFPYSHAGTIPVGQFLHPGVEFPFYTIHLHGCVMQLQLHLSWGSFVLIKALDELPEDVVYVLMVPGTPCNEKDVVAQWSTGQQNIAPFQRKIKKITSTDEHYIFIYIYLSLC